jgi:cyclohexyl-isocyanide hydratase
LLAQFGVEADPARVVRDGSVITGGGVTAGIDMALTVMAEIAGPRFAQAVQLGLEYAPEPPYDCGRPERAAPEVLQAVLKRMQSIDAEREAAVRRAAQLDLAPT